ncbi:MAG TPA: hypothetical protein VIF15_02230 [Polyangiaceae bacterium]
MRPFRRARSFAAPLLAVVACSSSSSSPAPAPTGPVARFDVSTSPTPAFMAVPFPSDVYLQGGHVIDVPGMDAAVKQNSKFITHELTKMDGFSRVALALFYVDDLSAPSDADGNPAFAALDPTTLPAGEAECVADTSAAFLVDLDAADPAQARVPCRAVYHQDFGNPNARTNAAVGPARGVVLEEAHHYAAVLTSRVKTTDGRALGASADFRKVQSGDATAPALYTGAYQKVMAALGGALAGDGAQVVALAPYTTHDLSSQLYAIRDELEDAAVPPLTWDAASMAPMAPAVFVQKGSGPLPAGATASLDAWLGVADPSHKLPDGSDDPDARLPVRAHDKIAAVGTGVFEATFYLQHFFDGTYNDLDHATFATDPSGKPIPAPDHPTDKIWVSFAVPTAPMPAGGYPLVIYQHGLGGTRDDFLDLANTFCKQGWMMAAIDSITFGARAAEPQWQVDHASDFAGAGKGTYQGPDGFADADGSGAHNGSNDAFGFLLDFGAVRDQLRQAAIDTAQLVKVLRSGPDLSALAPGGAAPKIDPARIAYLGMSLGSIEGALAAAIEPHVSSWGLNVGGGSLLDVVAHGPIVGSLAQSGIGLNFAFLETSVDEGHPLANLLETIGEPGDPVTYAGATVTHPRPLKGQPTLPRNVLLTSVLYDEWVPSEAAEALARAGGWGLAEPNAGSNSGILDYKHLDRNPGRMALPSVPPQGDGSIHDTPIAGVTAVVVQQSPASHGDNLTASTGQRQYCIPFGDFASGTAFHHLDASKYFDVPCPYLDTQNLFVRFFGDGFAGKVPGVVVPKAPVRDLDADGALDDVDADPCNPSVK